MKGDQGQIAGFVDRYIFATEVDERRAMEDWAERKLEGSRREKGSVGLSVRRVARRRQPTEVSVAVFARPDGAAGLMQMVECEDTLARALGSRAQRGTVAQCL